MSVRVGFTGTQVGMSHAQRSALRDALTDRDVIEFHHGDCVGADAEADAIARSLGIAVVIHPPDNPSKRAFCARGGDTVWQPLPYIERNHDIVDETDILIAAPRDDNEQQRSGTWATVRYARKLGREIEMLSRDSDEDEGPPPTYDRHGLHIMREQCSTCIFRPGNLMHLSDGRMRDLTETTDAADTNVVCHQTLDRNVGAFCRGSVDRRPGQAVRIAERLGCIIEEV